MARPGKIGLGRASFFHSKTGSPGPARTEPEPKTADGSLWKSIGDTIGHSFWDIAETLLFFMGSRIKLQLHREDVLKKEDVALGKGLTQLVLCFWILIWSASHTNQSIVQPTHGERLAWVAEFTQFWAATWTVEVPWSSNFVCLRKNGAEPRTHWHTESEPGSSVCWDNHG